MIRKKEQYMKELFFYNLNEAPLPERGETVLLHLDDKWLGHEEILVAKFDGEDFLFNGKKIIERNIVGWADNPCCIVRADGCADCGGSIRTVPYLYYLEELDGRTVCRSCLVANWKKRYTSGFIHGTIEERKQTSMSAKRKAYLACIVLAAFALPFSFVAASSFITDEKTRLIISTILGLIIGAIAIVIVKKMLNDE